MPVDILDGKSPAFAGPVESMAGGLALAIVSAIRFLPLVTIVGANERVVGQNPLRLAIGFAAPAAWPATARVSPVANTPAGFGIALTAGSITWLDRATFGAACLSEWWAIGAAGQQLLIYENYLT